MNKITFYNADKTAFKFEIGMQKRDKKNEGVPNIVSKMIVLPRNTLFSLETGNNVVNIDKIKGKIIFSIKKG